MPRRMTTDEFIAAAMLKHGNRYDYSLVNYKSTNEPVSIVCSIHGEFQQLPKVHLKGCDCQKCAREEETKSQHLTTNEFIERAKVKHGNKFDYSQVNYTTHDSKVSIGCNSCMNRFEMRPSIHIYGQGCPKCKHIETGLRFRTDPKDIISRLRTKFGDKYTYEKTQYIAGNMPITVTCVTHGDFEQLAGYLLSNKIGCPGCVLDSKRDKTNRTGGYTPATVRRNPTKPTTVYVVRLSNAEELFYKVGITVQKLSSRFPKWNVAGYRVELVERIVLGLEEAYNTEQAILHNNQHTRYDPLIPFDGHTECFSECPVLSR